MGFVRFRRRPIFRPLRAAIRPIGYIYVADSHNGRVQYYRWTGMEVAPVSLGRVKALFR
jgi:hypothetical protein